MKTKTLILSVMALAFAGCQSIADRNAKTKADQAAGKAAAEQGRAIALAALEQVKGVVPSKPTTP